MTLLLSEDPTSISPVVGSVLALGVAYILFSIFKPLFSPLRSVPGPLLARYTRLWELWVSLRTDWVKCNIDLHKKYGPVVRIAPNRYSINDADAIKTILGFENKFDKATFYSAFDGEEGTSLFSERSTQVHSKMRKPIGALYSTTNLLSYEPFVEASNKLLIQRLNEKVDDGSVLDPTGLMYYYAFDIIGEITVGARFGFLDENRDKWGIIKAIHDFLHFAVNLAILPGFQHWLMRWVTLTGQKSNVSQLTEFSEKQINDRLSGVTKPGEGRDFIDRLLELENKGKATRKDTFVACSSNIGAGSDTTAITISVMLALLYSHPDKLAALRKEIEDNRVQSGRKPSDPISFVDAQKLPYLQAVILETLRINAPVGVLLPRVVSAKSGGVQVAGQFFPLGSVLGINPWVIHYNKDIFGPDADLFRPERWMVSPEETARLESCFLGFGAGNRGCIGRNVNMLEMNKVIPQIVSNFDLDLEFSKDGKPYTTTTRLFVWPSVLTKVRRRREKKA